MKNQNWLTLGTSYYPDYIAADVEDQIKRDLDRMAGLGLTLIRMGEFSWSHVVPGPGGSLHPEIFLKACDEAAQRQIQVIFCTPTATPPKWLCDLYPEILLVDRSGYQIPFGGRRHYDPWSPRYLEESLRISGIYGDLFGGHPAVVGWQVDNEFGHHTSSRSFSDAAAAAFRVWLKLRYDGDIQKLNKAYFNGFWSMNVRDFNEVIPPRQTLNPPNPHLELDFYRFMTEGYARFQAAQLEVLRKKSPGRYLTHNYIPMFEDLCLWTLSQPLDVVGYDHYQTQPKPNPMGSACQFALMRSLKSNTKFMILEQQPLQVNWQVLNRRFAPDWLFLWGVQAALSGASAQLYFSWQRFYGGAEQYHEGIVPHDIRVESSPTEAMILAQQAFFQELSRLLPGAEPHHFPVSVLVIQDFESIWAHGILPQSHLWQFQRNLESWLAPLFARGIGVVMVKDLEAAQTFLASKNPFGSPYREEVKALLIPSYAFEWNDQERGFLRQFVHSGGRVVTMPRTAMKTRSNGMSQRPHSPIGLDDFYFVDHGPLGEDEHDDVSIGSPPLHLRARLWAEKLVIKNHEEWVSLGHFTSGIYEGYPAVLVYRPKSVAVGSVGSLIHFAFVPEDSPQAEGLLLSALGFEPRGELLPIDQNILQFRWQARTGANFYGLINFGLTAQKLLNRLDRLESSPQPARPKIEGVLGFISKGDKLVAQGFASDAGDLCRTDSQGDLRWQIPPRAVVLWHLLG